jgi:ribosomal protein S18 acetylase RimI-like enzyme
MPTDSACISVRPARFEDWPVIVEFNICLASESEGKRLVREHLEPGVKALLNDHQKGRYLLAEVDARIAGQLMHTYEWSDWRNGQIWWLQSVYVAPEFRRRGVFRALFQELLRQAQADPGVVGLRLYVEEHNHKAHATYDSLGLPRAGYFVMERMLRRGV